MQYNPQTKELFTDDGNLIKKLHCPVAKQWESLNQSDFLKGRLCDHCQHIVLDTALFTVKELEQQVKISPNTCLKVDLNQDNLTITYHV